MELFVIVVTILFVAGSLGSLMNARGIKFFYFVAFVDLVLAVWGMTVLGCFS